MGSVKLTTAQEVILARVKRYPKGIKVDAMQDRSARILQQRGMIEYDSGTGIAKAAGGVR